MWISASEAAARAVDALQSAGVPPAAAQLQTDLLLEAELRSIPSHGLLRLPRLVARIRNGVADPHATGVHEWTRPAFLRVDGEQGLGPVVAMRAVTAISRRARSTGVACAAISANNHLGMLAYYVEKVAARRQIGIAVTTSEALVHPWEGREAMVGSNPIAIAVPAEPEPLVLDMATGATSMGRIIDHANRGVPLRPGWAVDSTGEPTTDPEAALAGAITPFGGAKGYGFGIALEALVGHLTSSALGPQVQGTLDDMHRSTKGDVFIVIDLPDSDAPGVGAYLELVRSSSRRQPDVPIRIPGDRSREQRRVSLKKGFDVPDDTWRAICDLSAPTRCAAPAPTLQVPAGDGAGSLPFGLLRLPRTVLFGAGQRRAVGEAVRGLLPDPGKSALICTDARLARSKELRDIVDSLHAAGLRVEVHSDTPPEVPVPSVLELLDAVHDREVGAVIGLGGGSCIDMAKVVALLLTYGGRPEDYYGEFAVPGPVLPVVAVPTTAGTGSEATPVAVLADPGRSLKFGVSSPHLIPRVAICDPELTYSCPPRLTAATGADALTHLVEAYTAIQREPTARLAQERVFIGKSTFTDAIALEGLRLLGRSLLTAHQEPQDPDARHEVMAAAFAGGVALGTAGTAAAHALQYPLGAITGTAHGIGVGVLLPYVMRYNFPARMPEFASIGRALDQDEDRARRIGSNTLAKAARNGVAAVDALLDGLGLPRTLRELGLPPERIPDVAAAGLRAARLVENNPRPLDRDAMLSITRASFHGDRSFPDL